MRNIRIQRTCSKAMAADDATVSAVLDRCEAAKFKAPCLVSECTESEGRVALGGNIGGRPLVL
jgi:hypothetical protein